MNEMPLVSILVALYNHEKFVKDSLNSILQEDYKNKELIIINDGSTDGSELVVKEWIAKNGNVLPVEYISRSNKGVCATANELITRSKGKYIVWLPSDDILINNTIGKRVSIMENFPEKLVLLSDAAVINSSGEIIGQSSMERHQVRKENYKTDEGILKQTITGLGISGATLFVNKDIYSVVGLYPENLSAEDWYFFQRAAIQKKIFFWNETVSLYRIHDASTSHALNYSIYGSIIISFMMNYRLFPGLKYKWLAARQVVKLSLIFLKIRFKSMIA